jgi:hypothetical protein
MEGQTPFIESRKPLNDHQSIRTNFSQLNQLQPQASVTTLALDH